MYISEINGSKRTTRQENREVGSCEKGKKVLEEILAKQMGRWQILLHST